ncbi:MAG TPA: GNAT family N-acetyltransferase [Dissulfurispiraceae bacterium]|nr:GNAT family N-acetyltransferase [Dissulfurispiraceae bacterium]
MESSRKITARNGHEIILRPAVPEDSAAILRTIKSPAPERSYILAEQVGNSADAERNYLASLDTEKSLLLVATENSEVIGVLAVVQADQGKRHEAAGGAHIGLHISDGHRGLGIGSGMLAYATEWAVARGFTMLDACIFTTNMVSLNIFKRAGFSEENLKLRKIRFGNECIAEVCVVKCLD